MNNPVYCALIGINNKLHTMHSTCIKIFTLLFRLAFGFTKIFEFSRIWRKAKYPLEKVFTGYVQLNRLQCRNCYSLAGKLSPAAS